MKNPVLILISALSTFSTAAAQNPGEWLWLKGTSITNQNGSFGLLGVASPNNNPPGLYEPCEWTDLNGNFWLYGGWGNSGVYAALWKYDPTSNIWIWVKGPSTANASPSYGTQGVPSATNLPGSIAHGAATWVDKLGNFWLFGGQSSSNGNYSDLWKYDLNTYEWTWMKGPGSLNQVGVYGLQGIPSVANNPGARYECAAAWVDSTGDLWQFGGVTGASNGFNDVWRFDISTNNWTWMKGSNLTNDPGSYGVKGVEDPSNRPCARESHNHWIDKAGCLWVFGGEKVPSPYHIFNDLWRYNPNTNNWTWMNGSNLPYQTGTYGAQCVPSPYNTPSARFEARTSWVDSSGNFFLFGGALYNIGDSIWNDLWKYCVGINQWIWISGDTLPNLSGNWGTQGVPSPLNKPNGRVGAVGWHDNSTNLYLFGGGHPNWFSKYNDLWKFSIDILCGNCLELPSSNFDAANFICPGSCTNFFNQSLNAVSFQWYFPGAIPVSSTAADPTNICYPSPGTYDVQLIASNANGNDTLLLTNYITVYPSPSPQSISQSGDTLLAIPGSASYQWYLNGNVITGATNYYYVAQTSGDYNVVATDANGCEVEAVIYNVIADLPSTVDRGLLAIFPNPVVDELRIKSEVPMGSGIIVGTAVIAIYNVVGQEVLRIVDCKLPTVDCRSLPSGMYHLEINTISSKTRIRFIKQ